MNSKSRGFTLIELMIVVAIIGILVSIVGPRITNLVGKAKEAEVKASLGAIRSALSIYYANNEGVHASSLDDGLVAGAVYLSKLPVISIPANQYGEGHNSVSGEKNLTAADDDAANGAWLYVNSG